MSWVGQGQESHFNSLREAAPRGASSLTNAGKVQIHDNWDVAGVQGTGSCDVSVADYVVPEESTWDMLHAAPLRGGPLFRLGRPRFFAYQHAAFALGVGRGALAKIMNLAQSKRRGYTHVLHPAWKRVRHSRGPSA
jgi:alkylation response protein AidB-like acyl-CoA dehydrogenase